MVIQSGGAADASLDIVVPNGKSAKIVLNETDGNSFSITRRAKWQVGEDRAERN